VLGADLSARIGSNVSAFVEGELSGLDDWQASTGIKVTW